MAVNLSVRLANLIFKNPVLAASGTFGYGVEYAEFIDVNRLGGFVTKGLSLRERAGNPPPRIAETPCGMLNAIGLQNPGLEHFLTNELPEIEHLSCHIIVNIYAHNADEFAELAHRVSSQDGVSALEINLSCPNVSKGGVLFGKNPTDVYELTRTVKSASKKPVIVKLTPNVADICDVAVAAEEAGADAISLINTLTGMVIDVEKRKPLLGNRIGGLSGPAIYPVGVRMVYEVFECVSVPIVGMGGIYNTDVALQYIMAGASLIQVGTANFIKPDTMLDIIKGLERYCETHNIDSISDIVGVAHS